MFFKRFSFLFYSGRRKRRQWREKKRKNNTKNSYQSISTITTLPPPPPPLKNSHINMKPLLDLCDPNLMKDPEVILSEKRNLENASVSNRKQKKLKTGL